MVGRLDGNPSRSILFYTSELKVSPNNVNIKKEFINALNILFANNIDYNRIKIIISDSAPYMLKFVKNLKKDYNFQNVLHITCVAHSLHRVAECIRAFYSKTNILLKYVKLYLKSISIQRLFKSTTGLKLPPKVIITRWGSWLKAAIYIFENFDKLREYFNLSNLENNTYLKMIRGIINTENFINELKSINEFNFLPNYITMLEKPSLSFNQAFDVIIKTKSMLKNQFLNKFNNVLKKNPDLNKLNNLINVQNNNNNNFNYCPIVSVDCERSFSNMRRILINKPKLNVKNLRKQLIINYNKNIL